VVLLRAGHHPGVLSLDRLLADGARARVSSGANGRRRPGTAGAGLDGPAAGFLQLGADEASELRRVAAPGIGDHRRHVVREREPRRRPPGRPDLRGGGTAHRRLHRVCDRGLRPQQSARDRCRASSARNPRDRDARGFARRHRQPRATRAARDGALRVGADQPRAGVFHRVRRRTGRRRTQADRADGGDHQRPAGARRRGCDPRRIGRQRIDLLHRTGCAQHRSRRRAQLFANGLRGRRGVRRHPARRRRRARSAGPAGEP